MMYCDTCVRNKTSDSIPRSLVPFSSLFLRVSSVCVITSSIFRTLEPLSRTIFLSFSTCKSNATLATASETEAGVDNSRVERRRSIAWIWSLRSEISRRSWSRSRAQRCSSRSQRCSSRSQRCSSRSQRSSSRWEREQWEMRELNL